MNKHIEKFQYIIHEVPGKTALFQAESACKNGARWIQYRNLVKSEPELLEEINAIATICDDWGCTLLVTNHFHLAGKADIQGFHLEDMDVNIADIRAQIGDEFIIGGSSNTYEQVQKHIDNGADYVGFGPFGHTNTKPNNATHIGIQGYQDLMEKLKQNQQNIAVFAVGGVKLKDIPALLQTNIHGIAVSEAIYAAEDFDLAYQEFHRSIH